MKSKFFRLLRLLLISFSIIKLKSVWTDKREKEKWMKSIKCLLGIVLTFFVAVFLTSCSSSGGGTSTTSVAPAITSANSTVFTEGEAGTFTVTATGNPTPTLTLTGTLPSGVTFVTGVLSGTPAAGTHGTYPLTITASNEVSPNATQNFNLTVNPPPPGSLDTTFGTGGIVAIGNRAWANALGIQTDGKIVAAGYSSNGSNEDFSLVRYNADGSLDTTFGTGGIVTTTIGSDAYAQALGIQTDGKIVAAGDYYNGSNYEFALVRYTADGSLDTTFGTGGIVTTTIGSGNAWANALGIQTDGKIVAAGQSSNGSNEDFILVRYWP